MGGIDNKAEKYVLNSPYVYAANNPVVFNDPDGNEIGNPNSESTKRIKSTLLKTETGAQIWQAMEKSQRIIYFHITGGDSKSDAGVRKHLKGNMAIGEVVTGKMYNKIKEGGSVDEKDMESAFTFNENTGEYDKTSDWDESHVIIDGEELSLLDLILTSASEENTDLALIRVAGEESIHTLQNYADFTKKEKDPATGKYKDPKKDKDRGAGRSKRYNERRHEREAKWETALMEQELLDLNNQ